jgi:hypothetical protein
LGFQLFACGLGTRSISSSAGENSNEKTSYWEEYKIYFEILKILSLAERENSIPNEKNSGLEEKRSPFYLICERL